jgi:membrane associated rhomboid family serine protease
MSEMRKQEVKSEIVIWIQYFIISLLAAVWAYDRYTTQVNGPPVVGMDENLFGLLRKMFYLFLKPWFLTFFLLSASRFLFIFIVSKLRKRSDAVLNQ